MKVNDKESALDFTAPTGGADLRSLALQPGSTVGGGDRPFSAFAHPTCFMPYGTFYALWMHYGTRILHGGWNY